MNSHQSLPAKTEDCHSENDLMKTYGDRLCHWSIVPAVVQIYQSAETGHLLIVKNLWGLTRSQMFAPFPYKIHYEDESQT
jgi:uncharacterized protein